MTPTDILDITPKTTLPGRISTHNLHDALAELVDNSIDAMANDKVKIEITIDNDEIIIIDNWIWMDKDWLKKALTLWYSEKRWQLWKYWMWLKTSCFTMWHVFEITTKKAWEDYEYRVTFNSKELEKRWEWKLECESNRKNKDLHYTHIVITDLKIKNPLTKLDEVKEELKIRFTNFLSNDKKKIQIIINDQELEEVEFDVLKDPDIYTKINEDTNYWTITWWVSLMPKWKNSWSKYWIHCYWNGRLIKKYNKIWFPSHSNYSHLFWIINLDFVDVQNNKKDFITDSPEYLEVEARMSRILRPLLNKSANFANLFWWPKTLPESKPKTKWLWDAFKKAAKKVKEKNDIVLSETDYVYVWNWVSKMTKEVIEAIKVKDDINDIYSIDTSNWENLNFSYWFKQLWKDANYLICIYNSKDKCLRIYSNSDSVVFNACKDSKFICALHAAEWLSRYILNTWNKKNDLESYFEIYSVILEQTCAIFKN